MCSLRYHRKFWLGGLCLVVYLATGFGLWEAREHDVFSFQASRVCVRSTQVELVLRHAWIDRSCLHPPLAVIYWPLNALRKP
jgi:hypothetical protein